MKKTDFIFVDGVNICKRWLAKHPEAYPHVPRDSALASTPEEPLDDTELGAEEMDDDDLTPSHP